ncbi:PHP domain-containing protein [Butyrivibrio sp. AE3006]|uniref:PHP domain-containing protein n=1 Tax=Butyrivibrio sp. AE3006 TaxID=1280673 RepID=UPI000422545D|nr:PHP domain-containing protein [Butyrivibrio sp. AE3006]
MNKIRNDLRTHTFFSAGGVSTLQENIEAARDRDIQLLAVTDPFSALVVDEDSAGAGFSENETTDWDAANEEAGDQEEAPISENLDGQEDVLIRESLGVKLLYGCEADIVSPEGYLFGIGLPGKEEYPGDIIFTPDFIVAGVSSRWKPMEISEAKATQMYINVIRDSKVLMLGNLCKTELSCDMDELLRVCKELHKPVEIDEQSFLYGDDAVRRIRSLLTKCAEENVMICADSGALSAAKVGQMPQLMAELNEIDFPNDLIMNADSDIFLRNYQKAGFTTINTSWGTY